MLYILNDFEYIDDVIHKCLCNNPKDRFQNIEEIEQFIIKSKKRDEFEYLREFGDALSASFPKNMREMSDALFEGFLGAAKSSPT